MNYPNIQQSHSLAVPAQSMSSQQLCNGNYRPNVISSDQNYAKKSYNYMASPNYLQYENTYQKYKNIYHSEDVSNFRDAGNGGPSNDNVTVAQPQQMYNYHRRDYTDDDDTEEDLDADRRMMRENKTNNIAMHQTMSSDDEGGFRRDVPLGKNQFNFTAVGGSSNVNNVNGNSINYSTKEVEPLLHTANYSQYQMEPKVSWIADDRHFDSK